MTGTKRGRPSLPENERRSVQISVRVRAELAAELAAIAGGENRSVADLHNEILERAVRRRRVKVEA